MRVKRQKPDDLIDALKHLKIADRRSRLSLRGGRTTGSLALLGSSSLEQTLRCRLTRSASSTSAGIQHYGGFHNYPCDCCCAIGHHQTRVELVDCVDCPICSRLSCRGSIQLAGGISPIPTTTSDAISAGSGFSPFTTSAGLLYSTLPTNLEFRHDRHADQSHSQHVLQSNKLRRSCGAGLSHLDFDSVVYGHGTTSTTQSRSSFGSATTSNSDRHHCCVHDNLPHLPSLTHLRLYRRLYSLIDHPCISWYNSSKLLRCPHRSSIQRSGSAVGKCSSHRHSLSLRHRHTTPGSTSFQTNSRTEVPPTLPDLSNASLALHDPLLQSDLTPVNCDRSIPNFPQSTSDSTSIDALHISNPANHIYRFDCNASTFDKVYPVADLGTHRSYPHSEVTEAVTLTSSLFLSSQPTSLEIGDLVGSERTVNSSIMRSRRNSDPEQWQLIKTGNTCPTDDQPGTSQMGYRGDTQPLCLRATPTFLSGHNNAMSTAFRGSLTRSIQTENQPPSWTFGSTQRNGCCRPVTGNVNMYYRDSTFTDGDSAAFRSGVEFAHRPKLITNLDPFRLQGQQPQQEPSGKDDSLTSSFTFRPSILSSQIPDITQPSISSTGPGHFQLCSKACGDSTISNPADHCSKHVNLQHDNSSLPWKNPALSAPGHPSGSIVDEETQPGVTAPLSEDGTSMQALQQELALLESADTANGGSNRSQLTSDVSVNELAAYLEHMVHIPGRMSEMAQRMYL